MGMPHPPQYLQPGTPGSGTSSPALSASSGSHYGFRSYASTNSLRTSASTSSPFPSPGPLDLHKDAGPQASRAAVEGADYFQQCGGDMHPPRHNNNGAYPAHGQHYTHGPGPVYGNQHLQPRINSRGPPLAPPPPPPAPIFAQSPPPRAYAQTADAGARQQAQQPHRLQKLHRRGASDDDEQLRPRSSTSSRQPPPRTLSRPLPGAQYGHAQSVPPHLAYPEQQRERYPEPPTSPGALSSFSGVSGRSASTTFTFPAQSHSLPPTPATMSFPQGVQVPPRPRTAAPSPARSPAPAALSLGPPFDAADWTAPSVPSVVSPSLYLSWQESPLEKQRRFETVFVDAQARRVVFVAREYRRGHDGILRREDVRGATAEDGILWPEWHDGLGSAEGAEAGQARNEAEGVEWLLLEVPTPKQRERGSDQLKKIGLVTEETLFLQQGRKIRWSKFYRRALFGNGEPVWKGVGGGKYRWVRLKDSTCSQLVDDKTKEVVASVREQDGKPCVSLTLALSKAQADHARVRSQDAAHPVGPHPPLASARHPHPAPPRLRRSQEGARLGPARVGGGGGRRLVRFRPGERRLERGTRTDTGDSRLKTRLKRRRYLLL